MKKFLLAIVVILLFGIVYWVWKRNQLIPIPTPVANVTCDSAIFRALTSTVDPRVKLDWLQQYNAFVCNSVFYDCVVDLHRVNNTTQFEVYARNHPSNNPTIVYYDETYTSLFSKIEILESTMTNCYSKHLTFGLNTISGVKSVTTTLVPFSTTNSCYSIPLFKGIFQKLKKDYPTTYTSAIFKFCNAKINGQNKVIFKVELVSGGMNIVFGSFDISDEPTKILL